MALNREALDLGGIGTRWAGSGVWWPVPREAEVVGGDLLWVDGGDRSPGRLRGLDLLERFARLADGGDDELATFCGQWGPLLYRPDRRASCASDCSTCRAAEDGSAHGHAVPAHGSEPVWLWRAVANDLGQVLKLAALVGQGKAVPVDEWQGFQLAYVTSVAGSLNAELPAQPPADRPPWSRNRGDVRVLGHMVGGWPGEVAFGGAVAVSEQDYSTAGELLADYASNLIGWRPPTVVVWWERDGARMDLRPTGLLSALGLQLAAALSKRSGLALCAGCGATFTPSRKPAAGRRAFCATCQEDKVPQRLADRTRAAKRAASRARGS